MIDPEATSQAEPALIPWGLFPGNGKKVTKWPEAPPWRGTTVMDAADSRGATYQASQEEIDAVNASIYLRRPLLITGKPGVGKSSLAYAIAHRLGLKTLVWPISTKSVVKEGLYAYDAIGRLQGFQGDDPDEKKIENYVTLGALGTALHPDLEHPRVVLIDEIDKSDVDLPNDLLHVLEEGAFEIPELQRIKTKQPKVDVLDAERMPRTITEGVVQCKRDKYPIVVLTSNGERDFPAPFLRRCIRLRVKEPKDRRLYGIVEAHGLPLNEKTKALIGDFIDKSKGDIATDQLLNAIFLLAGNKDVPEERRAWLQELLLRKLTGDPA